MEMKKYRYLVCYFVTFDGEEAISNPNLTKVTLPYELSARNLVRIELKLKRKLKAKKVVILNYRPWEDK